MVGHNFVQATLERRHEAISQALKDALWQTQQGKCAKCRDQRKSWEMSHMTLVADGGSAGDIYLVCVSCYAEETTGMPTNVTLPPFASSVRSGFLLQSAIWLQQIFA